MQNLRRPNKEESGVLIGILAIIFGGFVRLYPANIAGFPINDGGLFVVMIEAIKANSLRLPQYILYNGLNIPFAYPPFAFYIGAISSNLLNLSPIDIVRWLPGIVSVGTVPAFYYLSRAILNSSYQAGLATLAFAFTPRSFTWTIMGGGLTRSFGLLFLLLSLGCIYRLFKERDRKYIFGSILFSALIVLSHPEAMVHTIAFVLLFWIFIGRNKQGIINSLLLALGTMIVTCVWWLPTVIHLGLNPFLAAAQTGSQTPLSILYPFLLTQTDEPYLTFVAVLGLIGLFACLAKKNYFIPIWYFVPYLVDPRSAATYAMIPLAMMAGIALSEVILPFIAVLANNSNDAGLGQDLVAVTFLVFAGIYMLGGTLYFDNQIAASTLSEANRTAFDWIKSNTQAGSRFLIMTGEGQILCDSVQEWFPALTDRIDITTIQGNEWLPDHKYAGAVTLQTDVQGCLDATSPFSCINKYHLQFDYLYINTQGNLKNSCRVVAPVSHGVGLINLMKINNQYHLAYQSDAVAIFSALH